ncbi:Mitochodrial transcription termination factor-related [Cinnamomum micranthum f. kanehirae]|uniref:Mitochodrial transcription termination factor-related n=1 Tax=Cinnamomum micranthum f. kanehirae TaxID=337451 RepID=A0A3S3Q4Z7_9MAGN|nr:Mitochodrial transcription termination factor-related [Cinnamomum micranthum f. kanehirae]
MIAESREKFSARFLLQNVSSLRLKYSISNPTVTKPHSFTVSYLVNSCGLSPESALSASKKLNLKTPKNPDSVIELLRNHGFTNTQINKLVTKAPSILSSNPKKTLLRMINVLKRYGISGTDLIKVISSNPSLFQAGVNTEIIPSFDFLRSLVKTDKNIVNIVRRSSRVLQSNLEKAIGPNIAIIRSQGVPDSNIVNLMMTHPRTVLLGVERFREIVAFVKKMGFNPSTPKFTFAIRIMSALKKLNWERKMKVYQGLGWSEEECLSAFKLQPQCMLISEKKIKQLADFF